MAGVTEDVLEGVSRPCRVARQRAGAQAGMQARGNEWSISELASALWTLSRRGLRSQGALNAAGQDESIYLAPLEEIVEEGVTLADRHLMQFGEGPLDPVAARALFEATQLAYSF